MERPTSDDNKYWFHLVPQSSVALFDRSPPQAVLLTQPAVSLDLEFFHSVLFPFISWLPAKSGVWNDLPGGSVFLVVGC
jgi:hypothetical protein